MNFFLYIYSLKYVIVTNMLCTLLIIPSFVVFQQRDRVTRFWILFVAPNFVSEPIWIGYNSFVNFFVLAKLSFSKFEIRVSTVNSAWCSASLLSIFFRLCGAPCSNLICCFFHQFSLNLNLRFGFFPAGCFYILKFENNLSLPSTSWQACLLA